MNVPEKENVNTENVNVSRGGQEKTARFVHALICVQVMEYAIQILSHVDVHLVISEMTALSKNA